MLHALLSRRPQLSLAIIAIHEQLKRLYSSSVHLLIPCSLSTGAPRLQRRWRSYVATLPLQTRSEDLPSNHCMRLLVGCHKATRDKHAHCIDVAPTKHRRRRLGTPCCLQLWFRLKSHQREVQHDPLDLNIVGMGV